MAERLPKSQLKLLKERALMNIITFGLIGISFLGIIGLTSCKTPEQNFPSKITAQECIIDTEILYEGDIISPKNKSNIAPFPGAKLHNPVVQMAGNIPMYVVLWGDPYEKFMIEKSKTTQVTTPCMSVQGSFRSYANSKMEITLDDGRIIQSWAEPKGRK